MRVIFFFVLTVCCCACKKTPTTKTLDFGHFVIDVPATWQNAKAKGIDSFVGLMVMDYGDTASFDLGWYSSSLEDNVYIHEDSSVFLVNDEGDLLFQGKADTVDVEKLRTTVVNWMLIDDRLAKVIKPKKSGKGMTGIYFDSLWMAGNGVVRFQMNAKNIHPHNERRLLVAFQTLRFIQR